MAKTAIWLFEIIANTKYDPLCAFLYDPEIDIPIEVWFFTDQCMFVT